MLRERLVPVTGDESPLATRSRASSITSINDIADSNNNTSNTAGPSSPRGIEPVALLRSSSAPFESYHPSLQPHDERHDRRRTLESSFALLATPQRSYHSLQIDVEPRRPRSRASSIFSDDSVSPSVELSSPYNQQQTKHRSRSITSITSPYIPRAYSGDVLPRAYSSSETSLNSSIDSGYGNDENSVEARNLHYSLQDDSSGINGVRMPRPIKRLSSIRPTYKSPYKSSCKQRDRNGSKNDRRGHHSRRYCYCCCPRRPCSPAILLVRSMRLVFLLFILVLLCYLAIMIVLQMRTTTLYSNRVCRTVNHQSSSDIVALYRQAQPLSIMEEFPVVQTAPTVGANRFSAACLYLLSSVFGILPLLHYTVSSSLSALAPKIRVPTDFVSIVPDFVPDYNNSRLLDLPINFFRIGGSHNSYHMPSSYPLPPHQYGHSSFYAQLGDYSDGVRQLELDIHLLSGDGGFVLYHVQLVDDHTNCYCLVQCLREVRLWTERYAMHFPLFLMVEIKRQLYEDLQVGLNGITCNDLYNLEIAIKDVFDSSKFLLPRQVRGAFPTVFQAVSYQNYIQRKNNTYNNTSENDRPTASEDAAMAPLAQYANASGADGYGWPSLRSMLGRVLFVWLDDVHQYADRLSCVTDDYASQHSLMFIAQNAWNKSFTAIQVSRNPILEYVPPLVNRSLRHGLILRTLSTTASFAKLDTQKYYSALQYGVHIIASDFEPPCHGNHRSINASTGDWYDWNENGRWCERLPTGWPFECHPLLSPAWCQSELRLVRAAAVQH